MLNLFGVPVPDDVAAAFIAAAVASKRAEEAKKSFKPGDPLGKNEAPDMEGKAKKSAETAKKFLDAYMAQGFTRSEAFQLTKGKLIIKL